MNTQNRKPSVLRLEDGRTLVAPSKVVGEICHILAMAELPETMIEAVRKKCWLLAKTDMEEFNRLQLELMNNTK